MNTLSWLLYAADVLDKFGALLGLGSTSVLIGCAAVRLFSHMEGVENPPNVKPYVFAAIATLTIACTLPSKRTVYMIAASETAEKVAATPEAKALLDAVRQRIMNALGEKA